MCMYVYMSTSNPLGGGRLPNLEVLKVAIIDDVVLIAGRTSGAASDSEDRDHFTSQIPEGTGQL